MRIFKSISTIAILLMFCQSILAQGSTEFTTKRNLGFKESSKTQTVDLKISDNTEGLRLKIMCNVREGDVTIIIINPAGEKEGEFTVEGNEGTEEDGSLFSMLKEGVSGQINKTIAKPSQGTWVIKFLPKNATGRVEIQSSQYTM